MEMDMIPGAPRPDDIQSDSIELFWEHPKCLSPDKPVTEYELRFKEEPNSKWKTYSECPDRACVRIKGLTSGSSYKFKVRATFGDFEGQYSPESAVITTKENLALLLLPFTAKLKERGKCTPAVHHILSTEIKNARNRTAKTRKLKIDLHQSSIKRAFEKTILLVGETGSGKSTLVDGFINYIVGVNYDDPHRFTAVDLESEEKGKSQATSQTEWVTCYTIHTFPGSRIPYTLNIIDTPGFGDTRGMDRDTILFDQLRHLFSSKGEKGVVFIDAVCILMKAPDARLTSHMTSMFESIFSVFGKDIKDNICGLITFADSERPPILSALREAKLPVKLGYVFNNQFSDNNDSYDLGRIFWEMGKKSFHQFFEDLEKMQPKSLQQTKEVLEKRRKILVTVINLQPIIGACIKKREEVREEIWKLREHEIDIAKNKHFEYTVPETQIMISDLPKGEYATNCLKCKITCHRNCWRGPDLFNYFCSVMDWRGNCTVCEGKCATGDHTNKPFIYRFVTKEVTKTYDDQLKKYEAAKEKKLTHQQCLEEMKEDLAEFEANIISMLKEIRKDKNDLSEIALQPNVISGEEDFHLMSQTPEGEKTEGFQELITAMEDLKGRSDFCKEVACFCEDIAATNTVENQKTHERKKKRGRGKLFAFYFHDIFDKPSTIF